MGPPPAADSPVTLHPIAGTLPSDMTTGHCAFCNQTRDLADEDWISIWAGRVLRTLAGGEMDVVYSTRQVDADRATVLQHDHRRRQTYSAIKLKGVCRVCNNGWMSDIEREVKPILEPMIRDVRTAIPVRHQEPLARWMALKTLEADLIPHGYPTAGPADFQAFYVNPTPPAKFRADLGRLDLQGKEDSYFSIEPYTAAQEGHGLAVRDPLAVQVSMSLGPVWLQTVYVNLAGQGYPDLPTRGVEPYWTTVWPQDHEVNWPPPMSFTVDQLPDSVGKFSEAEEWIAKHVKPKT